MANLIQTLQKETYTMSPQETQGQVSLKWTFPKKDFFPVQINEVCPQQDYVHYRKPSLLDAPINKQTKYDLERLKEQNHDALAEDKRQIGITPLITMSIDTGDHLLKQRNLMLWLSNIMTGSEMKLINCSKQMSSEKATQVGQPPIVVVPKGDGGKRLWMDFRALNAIMRT